MTISFARGRSDQYSPARKIQNKIKHDCCYFDRRRLLCSAIYKIVELNSTQELFNQLTTQLTIHTPFFDDPTNINFLVWIGKSNRTSTKANLILKQTTIHGKSWKVVNRCIFAKLYQKKPVCKKYWAFKSQFCCNITLFFCFLAFTQANVVGFLQYQDIFGQKNFLF